MGISSTSNSWRPGVIANASARPSNPYEGQVVYQTDTNQTLVWDGAAWLVINGGASGYQYVQTVTFSTVGTATFSKASYPWLRAIRVRVQGGGGGGGGCATTTASQMSTGAGGGGGGYSEKFITDIAGLSSSVTVTVGAAGNGGTGNADGGAGGASSFGSLAVGNGGGGGLKFSAETVVPLSRVGGTGGTATDGDININGQPGHMNFQGGTGGSQVIGGAGGSAVLGSGGAHSQVTAGNAGSGYGGGGGGASNSGGYSARNGGNGTQGIVIVELYA